MAKTKKTAEPAGVYISRLPTKVRKGYAFLCHNHIRHEVDTKPNVNGFRAWWAKELTEGFEPCKCGWSGLPHYHLKAISSLIV
jgi:hypothetical protein